MQTVWGFAELEKHPAWTKGVSDESPYVSRVEAYLRLTLQPYVKAETKGLMENPRCKVPFANIKGQMVDDSSLIIDALCNSFDVKIDAHLTKEQLATGHMIRQLLFGSLYWVILHQAFETDAGRHHFNDGLSQKLPPVIRNLVKALVFRNLHTCLYGSGIGRMPHSEIVKKGQADVRCLSQVLGNKKYFLGDDKPTSYDSDFYSWLVLLFSDEPQTANPWVPEIAKECSNLVEYTERMRALLYPELSNPAQG
jgi:hypothetical protein